MKTLRIKDICDKGSSNLKQKDVENQNGVYPVFGASGLIGKIDTYHQNKDYIAIVKDGSGIGRVTFMPAFSSVIGTLQYILPKEGFNIKYISYCLQSLDLAHYKQGAAIPHIYFRDYGEYEVNVEENPDEQQRIVTYLDAEFAKIEALKANAEKQLQAAKDLFQAALKELLTPKEGWEEKKLGELCLLVRGPFGGSLKKEYFVDCGYAVYEQQHAIYKNTNVRYYINEDKFRSMKRFEVVCGDLIMSCSGTIGKVFIIPQNAPTGIINQALLKITPKETINRVYLAYLIESDYFKEIISLYSDGAAIQNIAAVNVLKEIRIQIPCINQQQRIVARLDALSANVKALQTNYTETITLCNDLKQALLKKVFE